MERKAIAEKLRECANMLLERANDIQLTEVAALPESGRAAESDYDKAIEIIRETRRASVSHFQRKIGWGYNHACVVIDRLEEDGVIGPDTGGPREIFWDKIPRNSRA